MLTIDGSGGGGQLVRTALSLSALAGRPFRMTGIREGRPNPGLRPQHLAAVRAVAAITGADVDGAAEGSTSLEFDPSEVRPGRYEVDIGTAGCVTLVFDAVLPLATVLDGVLSLAARGGTDVRWAPSLDYFGRVKLPLLRRQGVVAALDVDRRGFYPVGGGEAALTLAPSTPEPLALTDPDGRVTARTYSVASPDLADREVAERQEAAAVEGLGRHGVAVVGRTVEYADAPSPGSALTLRLERGPAVAGADALGEPGKPAESVAADAVEDAAAWLESDAAVDVHMADQLLVFLGTSGGRVTVPAVTEHVETNAAVCRQFGYGVRVERSGDRAVLRG